LDFSKLSEEGEDEIAFGQRFPTSKSGYKEAARQQLKAEIPEVGWE